MYKISIYYFCSVMFKNLMCPCFTKNGLLDDTILLSLYVLIHTINRGKCREKKRIREKYSCWLFARPEVVLTYIIIQYLGRVHKRRLLLWRINMYNIYFPCTELLWNSSNDTIIYNIITCDYCGTCAAVWRTAKTILIKPAYINDLCGFAVRE